MGWENAEGLGLGAAKFPARAAGDPGLLASRFHPITGRAMAVHPSLMPLVHWKRCDLSWTMKPMAR